MAAQRLGAILSNVTGTSKQILRVNESETGFEFVSSPELPEYTVTNDTTDRVLDADNTTADEIADVLATLIKDMATIYNGGVNAFQWSTSEQVYPFEKADDGSTLYAKRYDMGALPNTGTKDVALGIGNPAGPKIHRLYIKAMAPDGTYTTLNYASPGYANFAIAFQVVGQYIRLITAADYSGWTDTKLYLIYKH